MCEFLNNRLEIFVGRILPPGGMNTEFRVRVVRSYRGSAKGTIVVEAGWRQDYIGPAILTAGKDYLFYVDKDVDDDGKVTRSAGLGCATWWPIEDIRAEELQSLAKLRSGTHDGRISGAVSAQSLESESGSTPLAGVRVSLKRGRHRRQTTTDAAGEFSFEGLAPGTYTLLKPALPELLDANEPEDIELAAHGCEEDASIYAFYKGSISGRISLPRGYAPGSNPILAFKGRNVAGRAVLHGDGQFTVTRLPPGEYVLAMTGGVFATTYAPGTVVFEEAAKIQITGSEAVTGVEIAVPPFAAGERFSVKATYEDGRPVLGAQIDMISATGETFGWERTNYMGQASFVVARGERLTVRGAPLTPECASPIEVGPGKYPEVVAVRYSRSACRDR